MAKRWQKDDVAYLKRYAGAKTASELAERFRTDVATVRGKLKELGLATKPNGTSGKAAPAKARAATRTAKAAAKGAKTATKPVQATAKPGRAKAKSGQAKSKPVRTAEKPIKATPKRPRTQSAVAKSAGAPAAPGRSLPAARPTPTRQVNPTATPPLNPDAAVLLPLFEQALTAMHHHDWAAAIGLFSRVVAASDDEPELSGRARQYLAICGEHQIEYGHSDEQEDPYLLAVFHRNRGDLAKALSIVQRGNRHRKDERLAYLAAGLHAERGDGAEATALLRLAIELNPLNRAHALADPDFAALLAQGDLGFLLRRA